MLDLADFEPWWRFAAALLIGALLGLEREFIQQQADSPDFAGIRTFSLIALLGAVATYLAEDSGPLLAALSLAGLILLTAVSYFGSVARSGTEKGITTEVAVFLTFLFGALVMGDQVEVAIALAVVTALLLSLKGSLHEMIRRMSWEDMHYTLQFALVALAILPILPNEAVDPFGLLNPFQIWLMVVLVSAIGFSGYVLMKVLGPSRGINLMGLLGGLASSTATTISFSTASRENPEMSQQYARAVVLASSVMVPRIMVLVLVIYPALLPVVSLPLAAMLITGLLIVFVLQRRSTPDDGDLEHPAVATNPLRLSTAVKFGLLFSAVLIAVEFAQETFGSSGVYATSVLAGSTDVNAITLTASRLAGREQLTHQVAGIAIIIAALVNTIAKGVIAQFTGSPGLRRTVTLTFLVVLAVGVVSSLPLLMS